MTGSTTGRAARCATGRDAVNSGARAAWRVSGARFGISRTNFGVSGIVNESGSGHHFLPFVPVERVKITIRCLNGLAQFDSVTGGADSTATASTTGRCAAMRPREFDFTAIDCGKVRSAGGDTGRVA